MNHRVRLGVVLRPIPQSIVEDMAKDKMVPVRVDKRGDLLVAGDRRVASIRTNCYFDLLSIAPGDTLHIAVIELRSGESYEFVFDADGDLEMLAVRQKRKRPPPKRGEPATPEDFVDRFSFADGEDDTAAIAITKYFWLSNVIGSS